MQKCFCWVFCTLILMTFPWIKCNASFRAVECDSRWKNAHQNLLQEYKILVGRKSKWTGHHLFSSSCSSLHKLWPLRHRHTTHSTGRKEAPLPQTRMFLCAQILLFLLYPSSLEAPKTQQQTHLTRLKHHLCISIKMNSYNGGETETTI